MSSLPTLILAAALAALLASYGATPRPSFGRVTVMNVRGPHHRGVWRRSSAVSLMVAADGGGWEDPPARPIRVPFAARDPLAKHRAITGINAHVRWYQKVGSLVGIAVLVALMGVLLAATMGAFYIGVRVGLELLVG